jgi:transposase-like protein
LNEKGKRTSRRSNQPVLSLSQEERPTRATIGDKRLRRINAEAARRAVLDYLASAHGNIAATARAFGITRPVVYKILAKSRSGDLRDRPKTPRQPQRALAVSIGNHVAIPLRHTIYTPSRHRPRPPIHRLMPTPTSPWHGSYRDAFSLHFSILDLPTVRKRRPVHRITFAILREAPAYVDEVGDPFLYS